MSGIILTIRPWIGLGRGNPKFFHKGGLPHLLTIRRSERPIGGERSGVREGLVHGDAIELLRLH